MYDLDGVGTPGFSDLVTRSVENNLLIDVSGFIQNVIVLTTFLYATHKMKYVFFALIHA